MQCLRHGREEFFGKHLLQHFEVVFRQTFRKLLLRAVFAAQHFGKRKPRRLRLRRADDASREFHVVAGPRHLVVDEVAYAVRIASAWRTPAVELRLRLVDNFLTEARRIRVWELAPPAFRRLNLLLPYPEMSAVRYLFSCWTASRPWTYRVQPPFLHPCNRRRTGRVSRAMPVRDKRIVFCVALLLWAPIHGLDTKRKKQMSVRIDKPPLAVHLLRSERSCSLQRRTVRPSSKSVEHCGGGIRNRRRQDDNRQKPVHDAHYRTMIIIPLGLATPTV